MPAPQPQTPQERARQLSFLQNLLEGDPGILRKLLTGLTDLPHRASQGEFIQPGGETLGYAAQFVAPGVAMAPRGAFGMAGSKPKAWQGRGVDTGVTPSLPPGDFERAVSGVGSKPPLTPLSEWQGEHVTASSDPARYPIDVANDPPVPSEMVNPQTGKYEPIPRRGTPVTATPEEIIRQTKEKGGYTVNLETGEVPSTGIMAGKFANADPRTRVLQGDPTMVDVTDWIKQNEKILKGSVAEKQGLHAGTWQETDAQGNKTGRTFLDVSKRFEPTQIRPATKFAERTGQISMADLGKPEGDPMRFPPVGNFRQNLVSPEVRARWQEAGKWGEDYMNAQHLPEWWDLPYVRHVYGEKIARENFPGFLGATSTNTRPRPNAQGASEYARRLIKGEDIIQPDFRVEESAMGGFSGPGKKMGLEAGRAYNLLQAAAGETNPSAYRGPVVQEKVGAFAGDPNAAVIDRLQMRPVEDPSRGIYGHSQEATTPEPGMRSSQALPERAPDRELMKEEMLNEATRQGKTLRNFSAQIWAGIRERIKAYGEVWGVKGTAAPDESFSYNDHIIQLVKDKAKHLGIPVPEMEIRLRNGDANLLSYLLAASPVLAEAYKSLRGTQEGVVPPPGNVAP